MIRPMNSNHCSSIARSSNSQYYNWWQKFIVSKRSYLFVLSSLHRRWYNYNKSHRQSMVAQCHWICHSPFPTSLSARQWRIIQKLKWRRTRRHHCPILPTSPSAIRFIKDQDTFGGRDSSGKRNTKYKILHLASIYNRTRFSWKFDSVADLPDWFGRGEN